MRYTEACQLLGVQPGSDTDTVKRAYRRLSKQYHPDHNADPSAVELFASVQEAYEILRETPPLSGAASPAASSAWPGDRAPMAAQRVGMDVIGNLRVTLDDIFRGSVTDITFDDVEGCERCGATGAEPSTGWMPCPPCQTMPRRDCEWCAGEGQVPQEPCRACRGAGVRPMTRTVRVAVPRSARDGQVLRVAGKGQWGTHHIGDLRLTVKVDMPDGIRRISDHDLEVDLPLDVVKAVLGGAVMVPTLEEDVKIAVGAGSSSGRRYRLKGFGLYVGREGEQRGDMFAVVRVTVPTKLTHRQRELFMQLSREMDREKVAQVAERNAETA